MSQTVLPLLCITINYTGIIYTFFYGWTCTLSEKSFTIVSLPLGQWVLDWAQFTFDKHRHCLLLNYRVTLLGTKTFSYPFFLKWFDPTLFNILLFNQYPSDTTRSNGECFFSSECFCINYMCIIYAVCTVQSMCLYLLFCNQDYYQLWIRLSLRCDQHLEKVRQICHHIWSLFFFN